MCTQQNRTPLIAASKSGFPGIVKILLEKVKKFPEDDRQKYLDHEMRVRNNLQSICYVHFEPIQSTS